ncbi:MAG TPA: two-component regulator propeller domain-containing protein, partial [Blastocatellia bacterium]|nr:two-component regulator propeller domain-containing protein [Blastocatellia bacterium]
GNFTYYPNAASSPAWLMRNLLEDRDGTLWVSYHSPSLVSRFKDGKFSSYQLKSGQAVIRAMYEDREGNLWMGSDGGGLIRLRKRKLTTYTAEDGLPNDIVRAITDDGAGGMWVATAAGLAHARAGKFAVYTDKDGMLSYDIVSLCRDRAGSLWIGSNYGLTEFKDGRFINYAPAQGLPGFWAYAVAEDREGNLWVGTTAGLSRLRDGKLTVYRQAEGPVRDDVRFILPAGDGGLWLGTVGGLSRLKEGAFTNYTTKDGLSNDYVRAIVEEPDGALWLGTYGGGLNYFKDGRFRAVTTKDGLFDDFISRILEDGRGNFWLLGNRGIFRVNRRELRDFVEGRARSILSVSYAMADGMESSEGNGGFQPAGWRAADGKLWFPTIKGVAVLDPEPTNKLPPPVAIEQVTLDRVTLPGSQLVRIRPGQENLEIHYTGLSFTRPEQVKFRYQMAGLDHDWVDAGTRRTAYYPHLPPGEYTFKVIADNGDGVWNMEGASLSITVLPPFYRTWWFVTLAGLGVAGVVWLAFQYRVRQLKKAQAAQQAFSRQLIASQEMERKRIAAELHDSLGQRLVIIKNLALMFLQSPGENGEARQQIEELSAEASQAIGEVKEISYNLRPYQLDRIGLTKAVEAVVKKAAAASPIAFSAAIDDIDGVFPKESEINFYRIVQESVNNIVKHSQATEASVTIRRDGGRLLLTIRDNGKGFTPGATPPDAHRGGFGLIGISERAQLLGGRALIHSAPGQGVTVSIEIILHSGAV